MLEREAQCKYDNVYEMMELRKGKEEIGRNEQRCK